MGKLYHVQEKMTPYIKTPRSLCYDGRYYPNGDCRIVVADKPAKKQRKRKQK